MSKARRCHKGTSPRACEENVILLTCSFQTLAPSWEKMNCVLLTHKHCSDLLQRPQETSITSNELSYLPLRNEQAHFGITIKMKCWHPRDGSTVKGTGYSSKGPRFNSQHLHGRSLLFVTPVRRHTTPSSGLCEQ